MSQVVDHLADLTGLRDRDLLDASLAGALRELLRPQRVAIYRAVGDEADARWLLRARLGAQDAAATADPIWADLDTLPRLADVPARQRCLASQAVVHQPGAPALTCFPLLGDREARGVLEVETDAALAEDAERLVSSILRLFRNFESVLDYSERDTLTGLLNRKTFDESFYKSAAHLGTPVAPAADADTEGPARRRVLERMRPYLGVIDIDHFKAVNDSWGHLIGDEVLLLLSRLMRASFRHHDRLYRFGGEEFVAVLRCGCDADTETAFERLRRAVQAFAFPQVGHITVSVGFTEIRAADTPSGAFERADQAVYWVKTHGRNRVSSFADLVRRGELNDESKAGDVELF